MKVDEIRSKSTEEIQKEIVALKEELFKLRFQHATNQLENPQRLGAVKRDIARAKTILREQEKNAK
ncbi:MAG TPA: 50S ribosomal protein L29 [Bacillota bacterium]|nr:50S ribosomal protein L29 [Bacillota bacterium]